MFYPSDNQPAEGSPFGDDEVARSDSDFTNHHGHNDHNHGGLSESESIESESWIHGILDDISQSILHGQLDDAELLLNRLCDAEVAPRECLELFTILSLRRGHLLDAMGYACQLQDFANELGCRQTQSRAASMIARVYRQIGDFTSARRFQQLAIYSSESSDAFDLSNLALDALMASRVTLADQLAQAALSLECDDESAELSELPDQSGADWGTLALVAMLNGDADETFSRLRLAWRHHRQAGDQLGMGLDQLHVAQLCEVHGEYTRAGRRLKKAISHFEKAQAQPQLEEAERRMSRLQRIIGRLEHPVEWN